MKQMKEWVSPEGYLYGEKLYKRETLYTGTNGRNVERFLISPTESFIFKPLTNNQQNGKEKWIYQHVLPDLNLPRPTLLASSKPEVSPKKSWMILEDLGPLTHPFQEETVMTLIGYMANWQSYPTDKLQGMALQGPKPLIEDMKKSLLLKKNELISLLSHLPYNKIDQVFSQFDVQLCQERVFSHGDLHLGNFAKSKERVMVLDWEHAHLNLRHWDLYHILDLSHPLFPKKITSELREKALTEYLSHLKDLGISLDPKRFKQEYYSFASIFSLWMLVLIKGDLEKPHPKWPIGCLETQWNEQMSSFLQCTERL